MKELGYVILASMLMASVILGAVIWVLTPRPTSKAEAIARWIMVAAPTGWILALLLGYALLLSR